MNYYEDKDHLSNSNLGWLLRSPAYFQRKMKDNNAEKRESLSLERGTLLHMAILEPEKFIVSDVEPVAGLMGKYIELRAKCDPVGTSNGWTCKEIAHGNSGFKLSKEKVEENFLKPENQAYYNFLLKANGKICLTKEDKEVIDRCIQSIKSHKVANKLLFDTDTPALFDKDDTYNELPVYWVHDVPSIKGDIYEVACKSLIDRLVIDHTNKLIKSIDLKTTSKSVNGADVIKVNHTGSPLLDYKYTDFMDAYVNSYRYYRQQAYYEFAVMYFLSTHEDHKHKDYSDYKLITYCIAVETNAMNDCAVFEIPQALLSCGEREFNELLKRYIWHLENKLWDYPMEYYLGDGIVRPDIS